MVQRSVRAVLCVVCFVIIFAHSVSAQSISWTDFRESTDSAGTRQALSVAEGRDFFKYILNNPCDGNQRRDIGWEENFDESSVKASSGAWRGTNAVAGGYVFPLFGGFGGALDTIRVPGDKGLPVAGYQYPIDSSKYTQLSFKLNHTARSSLAVYWKTKPSGPNEVRWPDGSQYGSIYDGYYSGSSSSLNSGYTIYSFDMANPGSSFEQQAGAWTGDIVALRLDPSIAGGVGAKTYIDWVRVTDPDSAPSIALGWSETGLTADNLITIWVDTDSSGYDGVPLKRYGSGTSEGSYTFPSSVFPTGTYYFYVTSQALAGSSVEARSSYSPALTILSAPSIIVDDPSPASGEDYFTAQGNPADMSDASDVPNLDTSVWAEVWRQFTNPVFNNGVFEFLSGPPLTSIGNSESDVQVHLPVNRSNPLDPTRYRYLVYRLKLDFTGYSSIGDAVAKGWVSRPVFWTGDVTKGALFKAHVVYPDTHTYIVDLWDRNALEPSSVSDYFTTPAFTRSRIDPNENTEFRTLPGYLDYAQIHEEPRTENDRYTINFTISDSDSSSFTATLYYSSSKSGSKPRKIVDLTNLSAGANSYRWNTSNRTDGKRYYIKLVVSDGMHSVSTMSQVPVIMGEWEPSARQGPPDRDYDGDGKSDQVVFRGGRTPTYYFNRSVLGSLSVRWGTAADVPIVADFDGDRLSDMATVRGDASGVLHWFYFGSSLLVTSEVLWGIASDVTVPGDYDGDGSDDIAVYRNGAWYILYRSGASEVRYWGLAGDTPVPGDYDGDGKTDLAIWRPGDGMWWILYSGYPNMIDKPFDSVQWGLPGFGDVPVPGDYNGDGYLDAAVWRGTNGVWYINYVNGASAGTAQAFQFGLPGDTPVTNMDIDGNGQTELVVWRGTTGTWFHYFLNSATYSAVQYGAFGDRVPR